MRNVIFVLFVITALHLSAQYHPFQDSLDFFLRTKTKRIDVELLVDGTALRHATCYFDRSKSSIVWCSAMIGLDPTCGDTVYFKTQFRDTMKRNGAVYKYYFDKSQRLIKSTKIINKKSGGSDTNITEYFYEDSIGKRISKALFKGPGVKSTVMYFYEGSKLFQTVEMLVLAANSGKHETTTTNSFEYYPDQRLKRQTRAQSDGVTLVSEFYYTDDL